MFRHVEFLRWLGTDSHLELVSRQTLVRLDEDIPAVLGSPVTRRQRRRMLALVTVATGQVELALEVSVLTDDLGVLQHEVVRVEEAA